MDNRIDYEDERITALEEKIVERRRIEIENELALRKKFNDDMNQINMLKCLVQEEGKPVSKVQLEILSDHIARQP